MQPRTPSTSETEPAPAGVSTPVPTATPVTPAAAKPPETTAGDAYTAEEEALVEERLRNLGYL